MHGRSLRSTVTTPDHRVLTFGHRWFGYVAVTHPASVLLQPQCYVIPVRHVTAFKLHFHARDILWNDVSGEGRG